MNVPKQAKPVQRQITSTSAAANGISPSFCHSVKVCVDGSCHSVKVCVD